MNVKYTRQADEDLINCYIDGALQFGEAQADRYEAELKHVIDLIIAENPKIARERDEFGSPPVRIHHHGSHYIIYEIIDDYVLILNVLPDKMDLKQHVNR